MALALRPTVLLLVAAPFLTQADACSETDADGDGVSVEAGDCNDADATIHPGATELCDGLERSCDGVISPLIQWYLDADDDGFGAGSPLDYFSCLAPPGYAPRAGDCDDALPAHYPGAEERCDALDNDCDGSIDEDFATRYFRDADGDGFGTEQNVRCEAIIGYVVSRGDCQDSEPTIYPGAFDSPGDGKDQDCGGWDGPQPHVALSSSSYSDPGAALAAAPDGATVWVGPGSWAAQDWHLYHRSLHLRSTRGPEQTVLGGGGTHQMLNIDGDSESSVSLDGFTLERGYAQGKYGGALSVRGANVSVTRCYFNGNIAEGAPTSDNAGGQGGAVSLHGGSLVVQASAFAANQTIPALYDPCGEDCYEGVGGGGGGAILVQDGTLLVGGSRFEGNDASSIGAGGGAILAVGGDATMSDCTFVSNVGSYGGAIRGREASVRVDDSEFVSGRSIGGGAARVDDGALVLRRGLLADNRATYGGAIRTDGSTISISSAIFLRNIGWTFGGGLYIENISTHQPISEVHHSYFIENTAPAAGAIRFTGADVHISHNVFAHNAALYGGGIHLSDGGTPTLSNNVFFHNYGDSLYNDEKWSATPVVAYNLFWGGTGELNNVVSEVDTNHDVDPEFIRLTQDYLAENDDLHLKPDSLTRDLGDPSVPDADGSPAEPGIGGGPLGDHRYYRDIDDDGLYDGWERMASDSLQLYPDQDSDLDGLSNTTELTNGTDPILADSDQDGETDGTELQAQSDPLDWFSRPNGTAIAQVPGDFDSIQQAIDAIGSGGTVYIGPGLYHEELRIIGKQVQLVGAGSDSTLLDGNVVFSPLTGWWTELVIEGVTLQNGNTLVPYRYDYSATGGGAAVYESSLLLSNARIQDSSAYHGGGLYIEGGDARLVYVTLARNDAASPGGGISVRDARLELEHVNLLHNTAFLFGGGLHISDASVTGQHVALIGNFCTRGGGAIGYDNEATTSPLYPLELSYLRIQDNTAGEEGGAMYLYHPHAILRQATITGNTSAELAGGIYSLGLAAETLVLERSIVAYNSGYNLVSVTELYQEEGGPGFEVKFSGVYNPGSGPHYESILPGSSLLPVEPGFTSYDAAGIPGDVHLRTDSPLVNRGDPTMPDLDGSQNDPGLYGGSGGGTWDVDEDGTPDWFWTGSVDVPPPGFSATDFDVDDRDAGVQ